MLTQKQNRGMVGKNLFANYKAHLKAQDKSKTKPEHQLNAEAADMTSKTLEKIDSVKKVSSKLITARRDTKPNRGGGVCDLSGLFAVGGLMMSMIMVLAVFTQTVAAGGGCQDGEVCDWSQTFSDFAQDGTPIGQCGNAKDFLNLFAGSFNGPESSDLSGYLNQVNAQLLTPGGVNASCPYFNADAIPVASDIVRISNHTLANFRAINEGSTTACAGLSSFKVLKCSYSRV